ncbi:hypothetical protein CEQ90_03690 [Lewinellaceae bacterium SD302]|nr:hypothetical protein CEQ90_03690 [Lewinellaceae bacterium SD302]
MINYYFTVNLVDCSPDLKSITLRFLYYYTLFYFLMTGCQPSANNAKVIRTPGPLDTITTASIPPSLDNQPLLFKETVLKIYHAGELPESRAKHHLNMIGQNGSAVALGELELSWGLDSADAESLKKLDNYELVPAVDYVIKRARTHEMLIIAESHYRPEHRRFTRSLLAGLYDAGYRHLGLENLLPMFGRGDGHLFDSMMVERGYPLANGFSGPYAAEPEFGNLVREAAKLGFNIFGYERNGSSDSERDLQMTEHILAYRAAHPEGKIVCHGGWYHAIESDQEKGPDQYWMARYYKQLTGDDPLTIYQDALNEKLAEAVANSPYYDHLLNTKPKFRQTMVPVDQEGQVWRGPGEGTPFDILTVDPPRKILNDRPPHEGEMAFKISEQPWFSTLDYPALLRITPSHESSVATPIVSSQIDHPDHLPEIGLPLGHYRIELITRNGDGFQYSFPE